jgi:DNA-binding transcriptional MerR regulator
VEYRVEELARAAGVSVDTIRFYQSRRLLPAPERRGRIAVYSTSHLQILERIRELNRQGLTLEAVRRVLRTSPRGKAPQRKRASTELLAALAEAEGERTYTRDELAERSGFPRFLLDSVEQLGLLQPQSDGDRYTAADLESLAAARSLLEAGIPLAELLPLAQEHAAHIERVADRAVELFESHVRRKGSSDAPTGDAVAAAFRALLPAITTLVALHFQRTLIRRARLRLEDAGDRDALREALAETERARLQVAWR